MPAKIPSGISTGFLQFLLGFLKHFKELPLGAPKILEDSQQELPEESQQDFLNHEIPE